MAFTREFIRSTAKESGVEIPKELEDALINEHLSARDIYTEAKVKTALEENKPEPQKVKDSQEYKDLEKQFNDYKTEQENKEARAAREAAFRSLLKDAGVNEKRIDSIVKVSDIDSLELEDGKIKGADKLTEAVKTEWADFIGAQNEPPIRVNMSGSLGGGKPESSPKSLSAALHEKYDK